jgi:N-acetylglutamate synthase-like GNAT family acetyltransferase
MGYPNATGQPDQCLPGGDLPAYIKAVLIEAALPKILGPGTRDRVFQSVEVDSSVAGMGGLQTIRHGVAEMKRVYIRAAFRGQQLDLALVERLMADAHGFGFHIMVLVTGSTLEAARRLSEQLGFADIPPYPEFEAPAVIQDFWVFMGRPL